ncbi:MAG TPA: TlyA family RNA methyltransferase [Candidatus Gastranaerophilales bacterium]|nr:TlyA family RNA methyltransferase [Candidatus Gastranaerophilales bacterium]
MKNIKNPKIKHRLDDYLVSQGWFDTKSQAQAAIMGAKVKINNEIITKAGTLIKIDKEIIVEVKTVPYVSRGGFKLEKAVKDFNINVKNKICLDIGASTGGFTDFLIQNGAPKVYSVDVGYGQIAWKLRQNPNVTVIERTNIRSAQVSEVYTDIDSGKQDLYATFACIDVSFISAIKILENIKLLMNPDEQEIVLLIKPQFEAGKDQVPKSGVIKDKKIHFEVIKKVADFAAKIGFYPQNLTYSPITGPAGNIEYLIYLTNKFDCSTIEEMNFDNLILETVEKAHANFKKC